MKTPKNIKSINSRIIYQEAVQRGLKIRQINVFQKYHIFFELSYGRHVEYLSKTLPSTTTSTAHSCAVNKALTKNLLKENNIGVLRGRLFDRGDRIKSIHNYIRFLGKPVAIKKNDGSGGEFVFLDLKNEAERDIALRAVLKNNYYVLVEEEFEGKEYRFVAGRNKVFAVAHRDPANVLADGKHSVRDLVEMKNKDPRRGLSDEFPLIKIKVDGEVKRRLKRQKIELNTIPRKGRKIYLRKNSNITTGGDSVDVTDIIHPDFKKIAMRSVRSIPGLAYAGVDIMTNKDICQRPSKDSYAVLELNSAPSIDIHHFPYQGKPRNVAGQILEMLFPEIRDN